MICINYSSACLLGFSSSEFAMRMRRGAPCAALRAGRVRSRHVTGAESIIPTAETKMQVGSQKPKRKEVEVATPTYPPTADHTQVHLPHLPPAHGGSNGAPRPGLCALLSALWKSPENSGQKHILTRTPDIHLGPPAPQAQTCLLSSA